MTSFSSWTTVTATLLCSLLPLIAFFLGVSYERHAFITSSLIRYQLRQPPVIPTTAPVTDATLGGLRELNQTEYATVGGELTNLVDRQNPKVALNRLGELMDTNTAVLRSCHGLAHDVGHAAYAKYKNVSKSLFYQDDVCGSGYMHGIIESHFKTITDITKEMKTLCNLDDGRCFHGIGHGLMYSTDNNVPYSLSLCDTYTTDLARINCADGVFMENFDSEGIFHPTRFRKADDPFYPCAEQKPYYKSSCYFYAPRFFLSLHPNAYTQTLSLCSHAEAQYQSICASGVGSITMKQNIKDPLIAEQVCFSAQTTHAAACVDGMVSYYMVNFNSAEKAIRMCMMLHPAGQQYCQNGIRNRSQVLGIMTQSE